MALLSRAAADDPTRQDPAQGQADARAQQPAPADAQPGDAHPGTADHENLELAYARAKLALAEANLKRVEARNQKVANAVSHNVVTAYRGDVDIARRALEDATQADADDFGVWLRRVEIQWKAAEAVWKSAVAANQRKQGTVDPLDVERLRLRAELLRINHERGQTLRDQPRETQLAWRLGSLEDEIERLNEVVFRTTPARGSSPTIWYYYVPW